MSRQYKFNGHITKVIDGDTCQILLDVGFSIYHEARFRLARINAPEMKALDETVRNNARIAAEHLKRYVGMNAEIETHKSDRYGRYLAEIVIDGVNLSDEMLKLGVAVEYKGK